MPWVDQSDYGRRRADKGDVMCEVCEHWTSEYVATLDGVYLCPRCQPTPEEAQAEFDDMTPEQLAEFYTDDEVAAIQRDRVRRGVPAFGGPQTEDRPE